jgi:hypothetical protein
MIKLTNKIKYVNLEENKKLMFINNGEAMEKRKNSQGKADSLRIKSPTADFVTDDTIFEVSGRNQVGEKIIAHYRVEKIKKLTRNKGYDIFLRLNKNMSLGRGEVL